MTHEEEMALRELAAKPHYIAKVQEQIGTLSLWSAQGLQDHVRKAVEAEREACEALYEHEDVQAPVGNSAWGEAYQEGWAAGAKAYQEAIKARRNT